MQISLEQLKSLLETLEKGDVSEFEYEDEQLKLRLSLGKKATQVVHAAPVVADRPPAGLREPRPARIRVARPVPPPVASDLRAPGNEGACAPPMPPLFWILFAVWYGGLLLALAWEVSSVDRRGADPRDRPRR